MKFRSWKRLLEFIWFSLFLCAEIFPTLSLRRYVFKLFQWWRFLCDILQEAHLIVLSVEPKEMENQVHSFAQLTLLSTSHVPGAGDICMHKREIPFLPGGFIFWEIYCPCVLKWHTSVAYVSHLGIKGIRFLLLSWQLWSWQRILSVWGSL